MMTPTSRCSLQGFGGGGSEVGPSKKIQIGKMKHGERQIRLQGKKQHIQWTGIDQGSKTIISSVNINRDFVLFTQRLRLSLMPRTLGHTTLTAVESMPLFS